MQRIRAWILATPRRHRADTERRRRTETVFVSIGKARSLSKARRSVHEERHSPSGWTSAATGRRRPGRSPAADGHSKAANFFRLSSRWRLSQFPVCSVRRSSLCPLWDFVLWGKSFLGLSCSRPVACKSLTIVRPRTDNRDPMRSDSYLQCTSRYLEYLGYLEYYNESTEETAKALNGTKHANKENEKRRKTLRNSKNGI